MIDRERLPVMSNMLAPPIPTLASPGVDPLIGVPAWSDGPGSHTAQRIPIVPLPRVE